MFKTAYASFSARLTALVSPPVVEATGFVRPCKDGYKPAILIRKNGKIYRTEYGKKIYSHKSFVLAHAQYAARQGETAVRDQIITQRLEALGMLLALFVGVPALIYFAASVL